MKSAYRQRGVSLTGMLAIGLLVLFFAICIIKIAPLYTESLSVKRSIETAMEEAIANAETPRKIKSKLSKKFEINRITSLKHNDVKVSLKDGVTTIDARYESRVPLILNADVVMKFDKLVYEFSVKR